jgi:hypothetical protein
MWRELDMPIQLSKGEGGKGVSRVREGAFR